MKQAEDFPYLVAARIGQDEVGPFVQVLYHPEAEPVVGKAEQIAKNPLLMALVKSQVGDSFKSFVVEGKGAKN